MKQSLNENAPTGDPTEKEIGKVPGSEWNWCQIRVRGHLGKEWSDWFGGLELQRLENGEMTLSGHIEDQGALIGILAKLNRLNLVLTSICWSANRGDAMV